MRKVLVILAVILIVFIAGCILRPPYVVTADINNDGSLDMVITEYTTESNGDMISVLLNTGVNESSAQKVTKDDIGQDSTIVVDLNKDEKKDIVYKIRDSNQLKVLYGKGDGTFQEAKIMEFNDTKRFLKPN